MSTFIVTGVYAPRIRVNDAPTTVETFGIYLCLEGGGAVDPSVNGPLLIPLVTYGLTGVLSQAPIRLRDDTDAAWTRVVQPDTGLEILGSTIGGQFKLAGALYTIKTRWIPFDVAVADVTSANLMLIIAQEGVTAPALFNLSAVLARAGTIIRSQGLAA